MLTGLLFVLLPLFVGGVCSRLGEFTKISKLMELSDALIRPFLILNRFI